jgi:2-oxoglutarate ferredoxin oxidoreductase subunit delta
MSATPGTSATPVQLDLELCKACGVCVELCPENVFDRDRLGSPVVARPGDCSQCLLCELHCPDFAIEVRRRERKSKGAEAEGAAEAEAAGAEGVPALTRDDLVAATKHAADEHDGCRHNGEEG